MSKFWQTDIQFLKKVGPLKASILKHQANIVNYEDLLMYFPRRYVDRSNLMTISKLSYEHSEPITLVGQISQLKVIKNNQNNKYRLSAIFSDGTGFAQIHWFQGIEWIQKRFQNNQDVFMLYGKPEWIQGAPNFSHPEIEKLDNEGSFKKIVPIYPGSDVLKKNGIDNRFFISVIEYLLEIAQNEFYEFLPEIFVQKLHLLDRKTAFQYLHQPQSIQQPDYGLLRFKYEEMLAFQWIMEAKRKNYQTTKAPIFTKVGENFLNFYHHYLPFELTDAQKKVIKEIRNDCLKPYQMNRLVQGDVGSGKTIVAFFSMLMAIDNGYQCALMAPTEILALQHYHTIEKWSQNLNISVALLTGSTKEKHRKIINQGLRNGNIHIIIGTHALIEENVQFANLGLTIIDEQHKFGVEQRAKLWKKNSVIYPHHLVMTATPIPRTLALTLYGDLEISIIDQLPKGRKTIKTKVVLEAQRLQLFGFIKKEIQNGRQVYFIYPLVEESMKLDLIAVKQGYEAIQRSFPNVLVGIVHGKMKPEDKETEMQRFKKGETKILVSTTVIEVGVDVPNATIMVIENAERFGLSQLHQLRGRVGRSEHQSYCFLIPYKVNPTTQKRLEAMEKYTDGFKISEMDLQLRGPGDFLGTRQSGLPEFHTIDIVGDSRIIEECKNVIKDFLNTHSGTDNLSAFWEFIQQFQKKMSLDTISS